MPFRLSCGWTWLALLTLASVARGQESPLLTVAEKSGFTATARHAEVWDFCRALAERSPIVRLSELGTTVEGRKIPLMILADPPIANAVEAAKSDRLVVFAMGNIHAGEVDGKEGLLLLARDIAVARDRPLLKHLIIVLAPDFNADGGEKRARTNRPHQNGPDEVGVRANAQGLDLNRDFVKLESPEVRALVRFVHEWNPALVADVHTTNGSYHRYTLTYDGPRNPATDEGVVKLVRDELLPEVSRRMEKRTGYKSFFYGNFSFDRSRWDSYPAQPRFGTQYVGLRNRLAVLSESYVYAPYKDRVLASREFVKCCFEYVAEHKDKVRKVLDTARENTVRAGGKSAPVALQHKPAPDPNKVTILGVVEDKKDGKRIGTARPQDYAVTFYGRAEPTISRARPFAYLVPANLTKVVDNLQRHGIDLQELREDVELDVAIDRIGKIGKNKEPYQRQALTAVEIEPRTEARRIPAGTVIVRTAQALGSLASFILEPQSADGLCAWNFFELKEGQDYPVLRLTTAAPLHTAPVRPPSDDRPRTKKGTED